MDKEEESKKGKPDGSDKEADATDQVRFKSEVSLYLTTILQIVLS